jgi:hypothetical protein
LARPPLDPAHGALHRAVTDAVQGFLAGVTALPCTRLCTSAGAPCGAARARGPEIKKGGRSHRIEKPRPMETGAKVALAVPAGGTDISGPLLSGVNQNRVCNAAALTIPSPIITPSIAAGDVTPLNANSITAAGQKKLRSARRRAAKANLLARSRARCAWRWDAGQASARGCRPSSPRGHASLRH